MMIITAPSEPTHTIGATRFTALVRPSSGATATSVWTVELGACSPPGEPHQVTAEEVFVVLAGRPSVVLDGRSTTLAPGDALVVRPEVTFALGNEDAEPARLVCCMPVGGQARLADGTTFTPPWAA